MELYKYVLTIPIPINIKQNGTQVTLVIKDVLLPVAILKMALQPDSIPCLKYLPYLQ